MLNRIKSLDNRVIDSISKLYKPFLSKIMVLASKAGNFGAVWWLISIPFWIVPDWRATGINFMFGLAIAHIMGEMIIKHLVKRVRPCHKLEDDELIIDRPRYYSFPSGHTTASFAFVGVALMRCRFSVFLPIFFLAGLIGFSRVYLRVHYLTDVIAGVLLGLTCGISSVFFFNALF